MHTKEKILITTSFYPPYHLGGDATHCKALAEALVKEGHEVHVMASLDAYYWKRKKEVKEIKENGVKIHWMKSPLGIFEPMLNYVFGSQIYTYNYFKRLVLKEKFDVVHHHNISLLGYSILNKLGDYKNLYTAHDYWLICPKYDLLKDNKVCERKECFKCCLKHKKPYPVYRVRKNWAKAIDVVIAPSKYMKKRLDEEYNNVKHVYNFVIPTKISNKKVKYTDYFLFAGVLEKHKGILDLLDVFQGTDKKLVICGDGSLRLVVEKYCKENNNIFYNGWTEQKDLFNLMKNSRALIMSSVCVENNPLAVLEAYSLGVPVIGSNYGGIPELIELNDKNLIYKNKKELIKLLTKKIKMKKKINFDSEKYYKKYGALIK